MERENEIIEKQQNLFMMKNQIRLDSLKKT